MINRKSIAGALIAAICWMVGYCVASIFGEGMSAVTAYSIIVGWWLTAYISSKFLLNISLIIPLFFCSFFVLMTAGVNGKFFFYKNVPLSFLDLLTISLAQSFVICSPIIFDWLMQKFVYCCWRKWHHK